VGDLNSNYMSWYSILKFLQDDGTIIVPQDYHKRCLAVKSMLQSDSSGVINSLTDFAVNSASEVNYKIETKNDTLQSLLNDWLQTLNVAYMGKVPVGVNQLSKEYLKERWKGSSLCVMKIHWATVKGFSIPDAIWFLDGSSLYIKPTPKNARSIGNFEYYYDAKYLHKVQGDFIIQKPFSRWYEAYPTPYLIRQGVYRNFYGVNTLKTQGEKVLDKLLPYLIMLKKGSEGLVKEGVTYDDNDMTTLETNFKTFLNNYDAKQKFAPMFTTPFDVDLNHIIPDMKNILNKELYAEADKSILAGLGFIEVVSAVTTSRRESVMNPKPFITEVNSGVAGFKSMLNDVVRQIILKNRTGHRKYFKDLESIRIVSSPIRLDVDSLLDFLRSGYDRGFVSIATMQQALRLDPTVEIERREKEDEDGVTELLSPHKITADQEVDSTSSEDKEVEEKNEKDGKSGTESQKYTNATRDEEWMPEPVEKYLSKKYQDLWLEIYWNIYEVTLMQDIAVNTAWKIIDKLVTEETGQGVRYIWDY